jgi:DNA-binding transcriptional LysR family regulator
MNFISAGDWPEMELRQLEIFRALAEELHFTRAAARVHCVQSNVTTQIRSLEQELGTPLFDRLAKRVVLTDAGRRFLPYADRILSSLAEARAAISESTTPAGPLCIGAPESVLTYRLPGVLRRFRKLYPQVELTFRPYFDDGLFASIESGKLDAAVWMKDKIDDDRLKFIRLRTEHVLLIAGPKHPLVKKKKVLPEDLRGQKLLLTEAGCAYRKKLDQLMSLMAIRAGNTTEFSSVDAIKECVRLGLGLGLLPEIVVSEELARKKLATLRWVGPEMDIATYVVWHRDKWLTPGLRAFISVVQEMLGKQL